MFFSTRERRTLDAVGRLVSFSFLGVLAASGTAPAAEGFNAFVVDESHLFSSEAAADANARLGRLYEATHRVVVVHTVDDVRKSLLADAQHDYATLPSGSIEMYVVQSAGTEQVLSDPNLRPQALAIQRAFDHDMKALQFDRALSDATTTAIAVVSQKVHVTVSPADAQPPVRPKVAGSSGGLLGVSIVFLLLSLVVWSQVKVGWIQLNPKSWSMPKMPSAKKSPAAPTTDVAAQWSFDASAVAAKPQVVRPSDAVDMKVVTVEDPDLDLLGPSIPVSEAAVDMVKPRGSFWNRSSKNKAPLVGVVDDDAATHFELPVDVVEDVLLEHEVLVVDDQSDDIEIEPSVDHEESSAEPPFVSRESEIEHDVEILPENPGLDGRHETTTVLGSDAPRVVDISQGDVMQPAPQPTLVLEKQNTDAVLSPWPKQQDVAEELEPAAVPELDERVEPPTTDGGVENTSELLGWPQSAVPATLLSEQEVPQFVGTEPVVLDGSKDAPDREEVVPNPGTAVEPEWLQSHVAGSELSSSSLDEHSEVSKTLGFTEVETSFSEDVVERSSVEPLVWPVDSVDLSSVPERALTANSDPLTNDVHRYPDLATEPVAEAYPEELPASHVPVGFQDALIDQSVTHEDAEMLSASSVRPVDSRDIVDVPTSKVVLDTHDSLEVAQSGESPTPSSGTGAAFHPVMSNEGDIEVPTLAQSLDASEFHAFASPDFDSFDDGRPVMVAPRRDDLDDDDVLKGVDLGSLVKNEEFEASQTARKERLRKEAEDMATTFEPIDFDEDYGTSTQHKA